MAILEAYRVKNRVPPPGIKAHSTRAVGASWAVHHRASALQLCKAATWSSIHTFAKFYKVHTYASADASLGRRILQAAVRHLLDRAAEDRISKEQKHIFMIYGETIYILCMEAGQTLLTDTGRKKEKDLVTKEIEKLRGSIQILCRSALPLGKMMDYIQEDMDTMKNELQMWRTENREHAEVLLREQSVTDTAVDPLKAELAELEQLIKDQRDKICTVKGNILRNDEKIQKMVQSIGASGRD
ncbi:unnamed protein product [Ranitomeya imitator]|uniref:TRAF3-interacting protein 1 C-terminal domain-containing protein n=1 Tax=Ranitomeya imitator TaxID=111125 RepID=A0ABN9LAP4_9NEOB|nr:unnamed protein product [Ranitomeya imitator]